MSNSLTLEVCREFTRNRCNRTDEECRFAHPPPHIDVRDGRVTVCADSLRGRCTRTDPPCRYMHPPEHLKSRLDSGRDRGGDRYERGSDRPRDDYGRSNSMNSYLSAAISPYFASAFNGYAAELNYSRAMAAAATMSRYLPTRNSGYEGGSRYDGGSRFDGGSRGGMRDDKIEVCREFKRGKCSRGNSECRYAHPPDGVSIDADNYVTACLDYIKGRCSRDSCRYYHPPAHLQGALRPRNYGGASDGGRKRSYSSDADRSSSPAAKRRDY